MVQQQVEILRQPLQLFSHVKVRLTSEISTKAIYDAILCRKDHRILKGQFQLFPFWIYFCIPNYHSSPNGDWSCYNSWASYPKEDNLRHIFSDGLLQQVKFELCKKWKRRRILQLKNNHFSWLSKLQCTNNKQCAKDDEENAPTKTIFIIITTGTATETDPFKIQ